jgi:hypothetical protein
MAGFQTSVRADIAPGIKGGWASANPHVSLLQPNNGDPANANYASWKAGPASVTIGQFAFADVVTGLVHSANPGTGAIFSATQAGRIRPGFVQRDQTSLITGYLAGEGELVPAGVGITLLASGDVWAKFAAGAAVGSFVFASHADGSAIAGATSTEPTASIAVTTTNGSANLTGVAAGAYAGQPISGAGIPAGTYLVSVNATAGTAVMSANATASASITATVTTAALTPWRVDSLAAAGDIAKISVRG